MPETKQMVARCKNCGHSWNIETYDGKRKRKCPECGKYQVEYINPEDIDLTKELDKTAARKIKKIISPEPDPEPQTEDLEQPDEPQTEEEPETEQPETQEQPTRKTIILNPVILIAGFGLAAALGVIFFITRKARTTSAQLEEPQEE